MLVTADRPNVDGCPGSDAGLANSVAIPDENPWTGSIDPEVLSDPGRGAGDFRSCGVPSGAVSPKLSCWTK